MFYTLMEGLKIEIDFDITMRNLTLDLQFNMELIIISLYVLAKWFTFLATDWNNNNNNNLWKYEVLHLRGMLYPQ